MFNPYASSPQDNNLGFGRKTNPYAAQPSTQPQQQQYQQPSTNLGFSGQSRPQPAQPAGLLAPTEPAQNYSRQYGQALANVGKTAADKEMNMGYSYQGTNPFLKPGMNAQDKNVAHSMFQKQRMDTARQKAEDDYMKSVLGGTYGAEMQAAQVEYDKKRQSNMTTNAADRQKAESARLKFWGADVNDLYGRPIKG